MNWSLAIAGVPTNPANFLVAALYDPSAPSTPYAFQTVPKPGGGYTGAAITIIFTGVNAIVYEFKLFESTSSAPAGTVLSDFSLQPSANTAQIRADNFLLPGITSGVVVGGTTVVDSSLVGWTYRVEKIGYDTLIPGTDYVQDSGGGWHLIGGQVFGDGDVYVEQFQPLIVIANNAPSLIRSSVILTAPTTMDASYVGVATILESAGVTMPVTLPTLASVTDNQVIMIYSMGGLHINAVISCAGTDKIQWWSNSGSQLVNKLILGQLECLELFKYTNPGTGVPLWYVKNDLPGMKNVGEVIYKYSKVDVNTIFADGAPTGPLLRASYPRVWNYANSLDPSALTTEAAWNNVDGIGNLINRGKWSTGDGSTTFRPPQIYSAGYLQAVDGSARKSGDFLKYVVGSHVHFNGVADDKPPGDSNNVFPYGQTDMDMPGLAHGNVGNTPGNSLHQGLTSTVGGQDNHPNNFGIYALIRI